MIPIAENETPCIAVIGKRNAGKSSLVNAMLGREVCITSANPGTTLDSEKKAMELIPYGPIVLVDTAGIDDEENGDQSGVNKIIKTISSADFAIIVLTASQTLCNEEKLLFRYLNKISLPYLIAVNKIELGINPVLLNELKVLNATHFEISCKEKVGIDRLKNKLLRMLPTGEAPNLLEDIIHPGDVIVMVIPVDNNERTENIIELKVKAVKEALDENTIVVITKENELRTALSTLKSPPDLVIADSQSIMNVAAVLPESVKLTTFSVLMAHYMGDLKLLISGLKYLRELNDGDKILIAEACSLHPPEDETGRVKIPIWLKENTNKELKFEVSSGLNFPDNLSDYKLIIHCSGCKLSRKAMQTRLKEISIIDIPVVNYSVLISYLHGDVPRVLQPFNCAHSV